MAYKLCFDGNNLFCYEKRQAKNCGKIYKNGIFVKTDNSVFY